MALSQDELMEIEQIDEEFAILKRMADLRRRKQELLQSSGSSNGTVPHGDKQPAPARSEKAKLNPSPSALKLFQFLDTHGPALRSEILQKSGMPSGTVSTTLNKFQRQLYRRRSDKKWEVIKPK